MVLWGLEADPSEWQKPWAFGQGQWDQAREQLTLQGWYRTLRQAKSLHDSK